MTNARTPTAVSLVALPALTACSGGSSLVFDFAEPVTEPGSRSENGIGGLATAEVSVMRGGELFVHEPEVNDWEPDSNGNGIQSAPTVPVPPSWIGARHLPGRAVDGRTSNGNVSDRNCRVMLVNEQKQSR
ncbi:hypothetical protein BJF83_19570 [Nocardiopsis sp. CNR-923]|uniref:hypothetical protein n=1 Tax=Nocardiopsis sp. CNR-923 TaxID=1904965 RepID=UPI00095CE177|nr:hypothetical protein [Nocardiopsis sp. CNR-923]OLT27049.1 hypothetical protein BJF83_19570 [Nocardiopsis sp. CNR-923]